MMNSVFLQLFLCTFLSSRNMNNSMVTITVIVLCCACYSEPSPIAQLKVSWNGIDLPNQSEESAFMIATHVTQEEVEEYQHLTGLIFSLSENHAYDDEEMQQGEGRSFGNILPELSSSKGVAALAVGVGAAYKFWKLKSAFDGFRLWIEERRHQSITVKPNAVYIVENPHNAHHR